MAHTLPSNPFGTVWRFILRTRRSGKRSAPARHSWHLRALAALMLACMAIFGYSAQAEAQLIPPEVPRSLLTYPGDRQVEVTWLKPSNTNGGPAITNYEYRHYETEPGTTPPVTWKLAGITDHVVPSVTVRDLTNGTEYIFEIRAVNSDGSGPEASITATPNVTRPGAPQSLAATPGNGQVVLRWAAPSSNGGDQMRPDYEYRHYETEPGTTPPTWTSVDKVLTVTVGDLTNGTDYTFEVSAVNSAGPGPEASVTATPNVTRPGAPQSLAATPGNGQVVLRWAAPSSNGGDQMRPDYEYRHYETEPGTTPPDTWTSVDEVLTVTVGDLTNGTDYTFEVSAVNSGGPGPAASVTETPAAPTAPPPPPVTTPSVTAPSTLRDLEAESGDGQVVLTWTAPSSTGGETITGYEYRYHEGTGPVPDSVTWSSAGTDLTETVDTLTNGTEYTFELRAENSVGPGPATSVTATPNAPATPPGTLRDLEAESGDGQVVLTWTAPSSTEGETITGYEYRYHEGTGPVPDSVTWSSAGTDLTETVDTLTNGTEYTFELRAENSVGPGPATSVTATPSAPATTPVAEAGENRTIAQGEEITLDGSASTDPAGGTLAYQWTYTGERTDVTLTDADTATPTVTAPTGLTADAVLTFSLVVTDENGAPSAADTVEITVTSQAVREDGTDALTFHPKTGDEVWISAGTTVTLQVLPEGRSAPAGLAVTLPAEALTGASPTLTIDVDPAESAGFRLGMTVADITLTGGSIPAGKTATVCLPGTDSQAMLHLYDDATETWQPLSSSHSETHNGVTVMCADTATFSLFGVFQPDVAQQHDPVVDTEHKVVAQAWLARVGRTVAGQAMDMINTRLTGASTGASHLTLGGQTLNLNAERDARSGDGGGGLLRADGWDESRRMGREVAVDEFLLGSSFSLSAAANADGSGARWTAWGRGATTRFDGEDETLSIDGQVATGTLGADYEWGPLMAGVAVTHSRGAGDVDGPTAGQGEMETSLTSVYPYLRYKAHERVSVWGLLGYGRGEMSLEQEAARRIETDLAMRMAAVGIRGSIWSATESGGIDLAVKSDLFMVQMQSDEVAGLPEVEADARRVRLLVEGSRAMAVGTEAQVTPSVEIGVRYDGGDAETGTGVELGGGLRYTHTGWRLTTEVTARALLAHNESSYKEWGLGGSVRLLPDEAGRGLSLRLNSSWGAAASGATQMWAQQPLAGATATGPAQPVAQLNAEFGYGLRSLDGRGLITPYAGVTLGENGVQASRLGTRFSLNETVTLSLEGTRMERADTVTEHGVLLRAAMRW